MSDFFRSEGCLWGLRIRFVLRNEGSWADGLGGGPDTLEVELPMRTVRGEMGCLSNADEMRLRVETKGLYLV